MSCKKTIIQDVYILENTDRFDMCRSNRFSEYEIATIADVYSTPAALEGTPLCRRTGPWLYCCPLSPL